MEIKTPDLGVDSAEVSEIMVSVGDIIEENDNIVLLESDKASVEVPAPISGKVKSILVSVGDTVSEGVVLIDIEAVEANAVESNVVETSPAKSEATDDIADDKSIDVSIDLNDIPLAQPVAPAQSTTISAEATEASYQLPDIGVDTAEVAEVLVAVGDMVEAEQSILLVESDKASVEVPAPVSGKVVKLLVNAGDTVSNGQEFIVIASGAGVATAQETTPQHTPQAEEKSVEQVTPKTEQVTKAASAPTPTTTTTAEPVKLSEEQVNASLSNVYAGPAVRKLARQMGIDITQIQGTAINQRIIKEDIFAYVKNVMQNTDTNKVAPVTQASNQGVSATLPPLPDMSKVELWGEIERQPLTRLQKVSIPQLNYNTLIPQVTQFDLADITETENFRSSIKAEYKAQGIGLTILAFIVKAVAYALTEHPKFNSHLSDDNTELLVRKSVNMGIAVATPEGLVVPVIKNAQDKGIKQLAIEIGELAKKARDKKLTPKDITGASFTISSQGNLGGTAFTPLVTWPQVAILGVSESSMQPRWNQAKGDFEPRLMLPLSLSYDHRVINGADAAVFTRYIAKLLADPRKILM